MNVKKVGIICLAGLLTMFFSPSAAPVSLAAKGGIRMAAPKALPAAPKTAPRSNSTNSTVNNTNRTTNNSNTAQTNQQTRQNAQSNARTNVQSQGNTSSSGWGSAMRSIGFLAGGMFLGSMLSSLFGWGSMGFMADILGVLFNIILVLVIISLASRLWSKFRGRKKNEFDDDAYRRGYEAAKREEQFRHHGPTIDVTLIDADDDKRRKQ